MDRGTATQPGNTPRPMAKASIASQYICCKKSFYELFQAVKRSNDQASAQRISDEFGRFRVWAGNAGAHRTGGGSLDYRLREASHLHKDLVELLRELNKHLGEGDSSFPPLQGAFVDSSRVI